MLTDLDDLIEEVKPHLRATIPAAPLDLGGSSYRHRNPSQFRRPAAWVSNSRIYCPVCTNDRTVKIDVLLHTGPLTRLSRAKPRTTKETFDESEWGPSLLVFTCEQCTLRLNCLIFDEFTHTIPDTKLVVFPNKSGGLSTPHTPPEIKHFVDQAYKCQCVDANGAAIEMYRVALEQLLYEEGYKDGMLNSKIESLEADRDSGKGKPWAVDLDTEMLHILRKLGNQVAHPKDASALEYFDSETIAGIQETFQFLLADIYERPKEQENLMSSLVEMRDRS